MMAGDHVEISRHDMELAFNVNSRTAAAAQPTGERVISIDDLLAQCPDDLIWEEYDEENN